MDLNEELSYPLEYQVFGLSMKEPGAISYFVEHLPDEAVGLLNGDTGLYELYVAFKDFYTKTNLDPVDPIAFRAWLESESDIWDALGGIAGVNLLIESILTIELSNAESVTKILKHRANKRRQKNLFQDLQFLLNKKGHKTEDEIEKINVLTEQIRALEGDLDYDPLDRVATALDIASRASALMEVPDFLPTPFKTYNKALGYTEEGGYFRGAVHAIVAMSGFGKSTFAKTLVNYWVDQGYTALYINFEEAQTHWERVLMSQILDENVYANADHWTEEEKKDRIAKFTERMQEWGDRFMVRHDPDSSYYDDLELWLKDIMGHNDNTPDIVVIDTLQSMYTKGGGGARWQEFERIMVRLERLAKAMNAVFIVTSQQNSNAIKEKRDVIEQSDVGGSLAIIQKSSVVTFITQKKLISNDDSEDDYLMQLQIPKNRITGSTFNYDPPLVRYDDNSKSYKDFEMNFNDMPNYDASGVLATEIFGLGDIHA